MMAAIVEMFRDSFAEVPRRIVLDADDTETGSSASNSSCYSKRTMAVIASCRCTSAKLRAANP